MHYELVSADSHINEPPLLWVDHAPPGLRDVVPRVVSLPEGDAWLLSPEMRPRPVSTSAVAGVKYDDYMKKPVTYKEMRPGSYDPAARLEDQAVDGLDAEVLYPGIARALDQCQDAEVRNYCARTYNDWIAEYQRHAPDRLVGLAVLPPVDDGNNAEAELRRAAALGLRGAYLSMILEGCPLSHSRADNLWAAAEELRMPISLHIGSGKGMFRGYSDVDYQHAPGTREAFLSNAPMAIGEQLALLVFGGVFQRHPGLTIVIAESGIGWLPYFLERMDNVFERHRHYLNTGLSRPPSEVFREHVYATFQQDASGLSLRDALGVGNIMWASDYPHTDTTWPDSVKVVDQYFADVPDDDRRRITVDNCVSLYGLPTT